MTVPTENLFVSARYAESITRLAVGVELLDALDAVAEHPVGRFGRPADVLDERHPTPLHAWRRWPAGQILDDALAGLRRHRSGRFARITQDPVDPHDVDLTVRIVEPKLAASRALVPRRLRLRLFDDPPPDDPPDPRWGRIFRVQLFPGAGAAPPAGSTVIRGRVTRPDADGIVRPVRWTRVVARDDLDDLGWAHGDDRGEFVLTLASVADAAAMPPDPLPVHLIVSAPDTPVPDPADPLLPVVDPIWDLPVETAVAGADPLTDPVLTGRALRDGTESDPVDVEVALGRETFLPIELPPLP